MSSKSDQDSKVRQEARTDLNRLHSGAKKAAQQRFLGAKATIDKNRSQSPL